MSPTHPRSARIRARHLWSLTLLALLLSLAGAQVAAPPAEASSPGGPVILMGLDSELQPGRAGHGTPEEHAAMVGSLLAAVTNGGEGILVFGDTPNVRAYWQGDVGDAVGEDVTFVRGVENILAQDLDGFKMIGVSSSFGQISGGLTNAENAALIARDIDIAEFVNGGGGLLGKTQDGMSEPFGYVGPLGTFTPTSASFSSIVVTQAGLDLGLTQHGMDGWCCYHEVFEAFPDFMEVLITHDAGGTHQGKAVAVGGVNVTIPTGIDLAPATASLEVGEEHTVSALVQENEGPAAGVEVTFTVTDGPHVGTSGTADTDGDGTATFTYLGTTEGTDTIRATFVDSFARTRTSNTVTATWDVDEVGDPTDPTGPTDPDPPAPGEGKCRDLIAAQSIVAGEVCVTHDDDDLHVTYTTFDGWMLTETHLSVVDEVQDHPTNRPGNPQIGRFADQSGHAPALDTFTYSVPRGDLDDEAAIAAHAVVELVDGESVHTETAWGEGEAFVQRGNWAMHFTYALD